jgi:coproporphyrinogen III oxidase-like Fe-S oxidoreductase
MPGNNPHEELFAAELAERMRLPQRHRLLHGYPMAPLMEPCRPRLSRFAGFEEYRDLIIGVLPHPFCNPRVEGCGFCTFPHASFNKDAAERTCAAVIQEIKSFHGAHPLLCGRRVEAVYLGGGTANLTPWPALVAIIDCLKDYFVLKEAELTLEGVPIYFSVKNYQLLDHLQSVAGVRHKRISMGVQSFDPHWIKKMGREAFGTPELIEGLVGAAHQRDMTLSCDLLCNLPGQTYDAMQEDLDQAIEMGFDQICLYHLVLFSGLKVPWAEDPTILAALPENAVAFDNWRQLRESLLKADYVQTSLTNFERREVHQSQRRFRYEDASYSPLDYDGLGFGPGAISCLAKWGDYSRDEKYFLKLMNPSHPDAYIDNVQKYKTGHDQRFHGNATDPYLLFLTRSLAKTRFSITDYRTVGSFENYASEAWDLLLTQGLLIKEQEEFRLSVKGMFYADSVVGLLAWPRTQKLRGLESTAAEIDRNRSASLGAVSPMG